MLDYIILISVIITFLWMLYRYYEPKIEVVVSVKHYQIYLWYNKWDGGYRGRAYKYLFKI